MITKEPTKLRFLKSNDDFDFLNEFINDDPFFKFLKKEYSEDLISAFEEKNLEKDDILINKGDNFSNLILIINGEVSNSNNKYSDGELIGFEDIILDKKAENSYIVESQLKIYIWEKNIFLYYILNPRWSKFLSNYKALNSFDQFKNNMNIHICSSFLGDIIENKKDKIVYDKYEELENFYFLLNGSIKVNDNILKENKFFGHEEYLDKKEERENKAEIQENSIFLKLEIYYLEYKPFIELGN